MPSATSRSTCWGEAANSCELNKKLADDAAFADKQEKLQIRRLSARPISA